MTWIPYKNLGGDSGVVAYHYDDSSITVKFNSGTHTIYVYTYQSAGKSAIDTMKSFADKGKGLNSYISTYKPGYASKQ